MLLIREKGSQIEDLPNRERKSNMNISDGG